MVGALALARMHTQNHSEFPWAHTHISENEKWCHANNYIYFFFVTKFIRVEKYTIHHI